MLNIAYTHAIVVLVIFHSYMVESEQSNSHSLYSMTSVVVLFAYRSYKVEYIDKERSDKNSTN